MPSLHLSDFKFFRMWPRSLFKLKDENGDLLIRMKVPELAAKGVYVLYNGEEIYYVGKATNLYKRLHDHSNKVTDVRYPHWDYFSAFALNETVSDHKRRLAELEAILIAAMPRARNGARPRFEMVRIPKSLRLD
jgi:GIY-YIG catalytic domain